MFISRSPQLRTTGKTADAQPDVCCWGLTSTSRGQPDPSPSADKSLPEGWVGTRLQCSWLMSDDSKCQQDRRRAA